MQLVVLGLNHKTAPVEIRECYAFSEEKIKSALLRLYEYEEISECVILSTCNRSEMYAVVDDAEDALPIMKKLFTSLASAPIECNEYIFYHAEEDCIRHLFKVASSLDSLVVGEGQILSQVKKAYTIAKAIGTTSTVLNTMFHRAIKVGKRVRTETRIAYSAVSISYTAVELAKNVFGNLSESNVLVLGAGEMSELTARHLVDNGVKTVFVSNRSFDRAKVLADRFNGVAVPFVDFMECAVNADIVITSTGAPHYIITSWDVAHLMPKRNGRPIIFIDIAVPRDVEPEVAAIKGASLYNIDDLEAVVETNMKTREQEAKQAFSIIEDEIEELLVKFRYLEFRPTLALLTDKAERVRQRELKRALTKLTDITSEEKKTIENMTKMLMRKILRDPIIKINESAGTGREKYYLDAVSKLFKLEQLGEEQQGEEKNRCRYARQ